MFNNMRLEYEDLRKAITLGTSNGANVLQPSVLAQPIVNYAQSLPNIRNYIRREPFPTMVFNWDARSVSGTATSAADGATIPFSDSTFLRGSNALSQLYTLFQVTNAAAMGAKPYIDIVADELSERMRQLVRLEDQYIVSGDPNNSSGNPGLIAQTTGTAPTSAVGGSGKTLTHSLMDQIETYQNAAGYSIDAWFVSKGVYALLKTVAYNSVRYTNVDANQEIVIGYAQNPTRAIMFNGNPVVLDPNLYINGQDNAIAVSLSPLNLVTAVRAEPQIIDFTNVQPQFDGNSWRIQEYCTTVLKNPNSAVLLSNLTIPAVGSF
jgi:HK97 family phage major capsid protein